MPRHCVQMAKISRHSLNLKGKATTMEKENHRNGGKQGTPKPVEVKIKIIPLEVHDREEDKFLLFFFLEGNKKRSLESVKL